MLLFRVDNRLIHGQIIEAWLPHIRAKHLIVANDCLAQDPLRQSIVSMTVPPHVHVHFVSISLLHALLATYKGHNILVLLENCADMMQAIERHVDTHAEADTLHFNVGNLHYGPQKHRLLPHVAVTDDELLLLKHVAQKHSLNFCAVPNEKALSLHELCH